MSAKIIVCYPGGTGGNFVASIITSMMSGQEFYVLDDGSCHAFDGSVFLTPRVLNTSTSSFIQEIADIERLGDFEVGLGHFRNLAFIKDSANAKIVYIDFDLDDIPVIEKRLDAKVSDILSKEYYENMKGADWPSFNEQCNSTELPEDLRQIRFQYLEQWFWVLPKNTDDILKINFSDLSDVKWIKPLADFIDITDLDLDYFEQKVIEYNQKQK